ncbi:MAG TPA: hypothetical protein VGH27_07410 [Streptosporangiaceae bacterium]|jgi:hypothetical protein
MYGPDDVVDCSWLSATREDEDTYLLGNGTVFLEVPAIAVEVIEVTRDCSLAEAREFLLREKGVDVDVADFVNTLSESGVLQRAAVESNLWDRIEPAKVRWLFSRWLALPYALLVATAVAALVLLPSSRPRYGDLLWAGNTFAALVTFFAATWALVFLHELCHVIAARSLGLRAHLSLGTRMQFLVAQTDISGVWEIERRRRYRVYLAGIVVDIALAAVLICLRAWVWPAGTLARFVGALLVIKLSQIAWQFLVFTRTDLYYTVANFVGSRNLLADADDYLRSRLPGRERGRVDLPTQSVPRTVRAYACVLVLGRFAALAFFLLYTVPVTVTFCHSGMDKLSAWPSARSLEGLLTLVVLAFGWGLFAITFARQRLSHARSVPAES